MVTLQIVIDKVGLDEDDVEKYTEQLFDELHGREDVDKIQRVEDKNPPAGSKSFGALEVGALIVFLQGFACPDVVKAVVEKIGTKSVPVTMTISDGQKSTSVTVKNIKDLEQAMRIAREYADTQASSR